MKHSFILFTGYNCNYNCSYCFQRNVRKISNEDSKIINNKLLTSTQKVADLFENNSYLANSYNKTVQILGGEPMLYDIEKVIEILITSKNIKSIRLFSNMSANIDRYKNIISNCKKNNIRLDLSCSFHPEKIDLNDFANVIKKIFVEDKNIKMIPKLVVTNNCTVNFLKEFLSKLKELNIEASILPEYSPCTDTNMVCDFECNLSEELFNFTLNHILIKSKNNWPLIKEIIMSSRDKENRFLKEPIYVVPNLYMDYNGKIFYPCNGCKEIKENEITQNKLKILCNDKNCMLYNECQKIK